MHHAGATGVQFGIFVLVCQVIVDVPVLLPLQQLSQVGFDSFQLSVSLGTDPVQLTVWFDAVGVKVLVETVVFQGCCPVPPIGAVPALDDAEVLLAWQQLVDIVKVPQLRVLSDFGIAPPESFECRRPTEPC